MILKFNQKDLKKLWRPREDSNGEDNGQITIIGGSDLFTGAPLMSLVAASRIVDMVFLATPEEDKNITNKEALFSKLRTVIWVPREDAEAYMEKSDAVLIGPGLKRFHRETDQRPEGNGAIFDDMGTYTKSMTQYLLAKFPKKQWVIDGGSLQVLDPKLIPEGAIITPNIKEYELLFNTQFSMDDYQLTAKKYKCIIVYKGPVGYVTDGETTYEIQGGNAGLTKGGSGDVLAGMIAGLAAKNPPLLAAAAGSWLVKRTADVLYEKAGYGFNADDVANKVFEVWKDNKE